VAPQITHRDPHEAVAYLPFDQSPPSTASVLVRTLDAQATMTDRLRDTLRRLDPNLPIYRVLTMTQVIQEQTWNGRVASNIVRSIATIAFLFCIVGLYAVMAHAVAQRTNEIGVRMALGARPLHVGLMILKRAALHVALGLAVGVAGTLAWNAAFGTGRLEDRFLQPAIVGPIVVLLVAAMLVACWLPARRAIRLDPMSALRSE
jgi:ABC-type antimicrobial peptide transport system permease subunit